MAYLRLNSFLELILQNILNFLAGRSMGRRILSCCLMPSRRKGKQSIRSWYPVVVLNPALVSGLCLQSCPGIRFLSSILPWYPVFVLNPVLVSSFIFFNCSDILSSVFELLWYFLVFSLLSWIVYGILILFYGIELFWYPFVYLNPNQSGMPADSKGVACWYFKTQKAWLVGILIPTD